MLFTQVIPAVLALLTLSATATRRTGGVDPTNERSYGNETVFGIEFGLDRVSAAATLGNGSSIALVSNTAGAEYKALMHSYLETSAQTARTQAEPDETVLFAHRASHDDNCLSHGLDPERSWVDWLQMKIFSSPEYPASVIKCGDDFASDPDVAILAAEVEALFESSMQVLQSRGVNMDTVPLRPYAEITAPNSLYTTIKPSVPIPMLEEKEAAAWYMALTAKMSAATHRAGFRRTASTWPIKTLAYHARAMLVPAASSSVIRASHMDECWSFDASAREKCHVRNERTEDPRLVVVAGWSNAALDLWAEPINVPFGGDCWVWTPWSTYEQLGRGVYNDLSEPAKEEQWTSAALKVEEMVKESITACAMGLSGSVEVLLTGDAWDDESSKAFMRSLRGLDSDVNILAYSDARLQAVFAASVGAAELAHDMLLSAHRCNWGLYVDWDELKARNQEMWRTDEL